MPSVLFCRHERVPQWLAFAAAWGAAARCAAAVTCKREGQSAHLVAHGVGAAGDGARARVAVGAAGERERPPRVAPFAAVPAAHGTHIAVLAVPAHLAAGRRAVRVGVRVVLRAVLVLALRLCALLAPAAALAHAVGTVDAHEHRDEDDAYECGHKGDHDGAVVAAAAGAVVCPNGRVPRCLQARTA